MGGSWYALFTGYGGLKDLKKLNTKVIHSHLADMGTKPEVMKPKRSRSFDKMSKLKLKPKPKLWLFETTKLKLKPKPKQLRTHVWHLGVITQFLDLVPLRQRDLVIPGPLHTPNYWHAP